MIILLNGIAASGKTSIVKELQKQASFPLLKMGIDAFMQTLPSQYYGQGEKAAEGIQFIQETTEKGPITRVHNGHFGVSLLHSIAPVIALLSYQNLNVACDEVLFHDYYLKQYTKAFKNQKAYFIAVHCSMEELLRREEKRGGVSVGLANDQIEKVHGPTRFYDIEVDTTNCSAAECAQKILQFIRETPLPSGFKRLEAAFEL